jgi:hypothetical protein
MLFPHRRPGHVTVVAFFGFVLLAGNRSSAQESDQRLGVRHRIDVTVSAEPGASLLEHLKGARGSLTFTMRLSANSRESRYFGMLKPEFSDIVIPDSASAPLVQQTKVWEEGICHQRRGLPKVTVTQLNASFGEDKRRIEVSAINRHIGLLVPSDELTPGIKLDSGRDEGGPFYAVRAQTRNSRLNVDLKIYSLDCAL